MARKLPLLYSVLENFLNPSLEADWQRWATDIHIPDVLRRLGSKGWGALYKIEGGPIYTGWEGPSHVFQYIYVFELEDTPKALAAALLPTRDISDMAPERLQVAGRPVAEMIDAIRVIYRPITGQFTFPPLVYAARINWLVPEREEEFQQFISQVLFPAAQQRPGFVRGARYMAIGEPGYVGWLGPSRAYKYLSIWELEDSPAATMAALRPVGQMPALKAWPGPRPLTEMVNEVRAVYRLIMKTRLEG